MSTGEGVAKSKVRVPGILLRRLALRSRLIVGDLEVGRYRNAGVFGAGQPIRGQVTQSARLTRPTVQVLSGHPGPAETKTLIRREFVATAESSR